MLNAFDRYADFTDLAKLKEASARPLRRSLRVNLLKSSVEDFKKWAEEHHWNLEPVPWCPQGFFVHRVESDEAFGRDLLHQLGHTYIQEAASMLPVELLDPQPGEVILDLCAAPGSKTTQIAAKMRCFDTACPEPVEGAPPPCFDGVYPESFDGTQDRLRRGTQHDVMQGIIVANDVQEKRLWVLKAALHRSGVTNAIVTKKVGQWFAKHMTERFDRVLIDVPCTAQGTVRKDPSALEYSSEARVRKMAATQFQLLEAAVHATNIGGRIVYSTCTLTPEENEMVVAAVLEKYAGKVKAVDMRELRMKNQELGILLEKAVEDSYAVQKIFLILDSKFLIPFLRLWPHTFDTEGFFCAVLQKIARTCLPTLTPSVPFQEKLLKTGEKREIAAKLEERYGSSFLLAGDQLFARADHLLLGTDAVASFGLPVLNYSLGLPFGKVTAKGEVRLAHELATLRGSMARRNVCELQDSQLHDILEGRDTHCRADLRGDIILRWHRLNMGGGLANDGRVKNKMPRWFLSQVS